MTRAEHPMTRRVVVVPPELPLHDAWAIMKRHNFRHLPVARGRAVMGIISDRDILIRATLSAAGEIDVPDVPVAEAMSLDVHVCQRSTHVSDVVRMMTERTVDAVIVVGGDNELVGLVTSTDLLLLLIELEEAKAPIPFEFEVDRHTSPLSGVV